MNYSFHQWRNVHFVSLHIYVFIFTFMYIHTSLSVSFYIICIVYKYFNRDNYTLIFYVNKFKRINSV